MAWQVIPSTRSKRSPSDKGDLVRPAPISGTTAASRVCYLTTRLAIWAKPSARLQCLDQLHLSRVVDGVAGDPEYQIEALPLGQGRLGSAGADIGDHGRQPRLGALHQARDLGPSERPALTPREPLLPRED